MRAVSESAVAFRVKIRITYTEVLLRGGMYEQGREAAPGFVAAPAAQVLRGLLRRCLCPPPARCQHSHPRPTPRFRPCRRPCPAAGSTEVHCALAPDLRPAAWTGGARARACRRWRGLGTQQAEPLPGVLCSTHAGRAPPATSHLPSATRSRRGRFLVLKMPRKCFWCLRDV